MGYAVFAPDGPWRFSGDQQLLHRGAGNGSVGALQRGDLGPVSVDHSPMRHPNRDVVREQFEILRLTQARFEIVKVLLHGGFRLQAGAVPALGRHPAR